MTSWRSQRNNQSTAEPVTESDQVWSVWPGLIRSDQVWLGPEWLICNHLNNWCEKFSQKKKNYASWSRSLKSSGSDGLWTSSEVFKGADIYPEEHKTQWANISATKKMFFQWLVNVTAELLKNSCLWLTEADGMTVRENDGNDGRGLLSTHWAGKIFEIYTLKNLLPTAAKLWA